ncbi:MAG: DUF4255 domain-containing protein [Anaerolineae bacterium]|nr:DUF4255 domain-containing protein [Anaerolineae bacterium]
MIDHLDNLLRHLFLTELGAITSHAQVRFQPPDDDWRNEVRNNLQDMALNVYLFDLRENRKLRSNARRPTSPNGPTPPDTEVLYEQAPARLECHYLVTAWNPGQPSQAMEPTPDEHRLLYDAAAVLMNSAPLNPSHIYEPGSPALGAVPARIREVDLPTQILPVEGFAKLAEFWGTMGPNHRWRPAIYLVVTLPVIYAPQLTGPLVTTRVIEYRRVDKPDVVETRYQIGGHVLDVTGPDTKRVADAWVQIETPAGEPLQVARTNELGRFSFSNVLAGQYQLNCRAQGFAAPAPRPVDVPSLSGEYDLRLAVKA